MTPLVGMVDSYWVSNLGGPIQLAGQGISDQIFKFNLWFNIIYASCITSFNIRI